MTPNESNEANTTITEEKPTAVNTRNVNINGRIIKITKQSQYILDMLSLDD